MQSISTEALLQQARSRLLAFGDCTGAGLDARLVRSWQRSLASGLLPDDPLQDAPYANDAEMRQKLEVNHTLLAHSLPVMESLFEQVRHSQGMVILADGSGTLMQSLGHADFLTKAQQVALMRGASWQEQHRGTNAIGTALVEGAGVEIHGAEHFVERNAFLTCTAAPILSARGELLGILDISGDHRSDHPHTLGWVTMATRMIENRLMLATGQRQLKLHLHPRREGIGTVAEGIVELSEDGWVIGANSRALELLGLSWADLNRRHLAGLIEPGLAQLHAGRQRQAGAPVPVRLHDGRLLYAELQGSLVAQRLAPASALSAGVQHDALAHLDTGDERWRSAADKVRRVLDKPIAVLIQGESGVGKELFARAAHDSGPRRGKPFVAINCAAVPENLIEAELFGYAGGAFTGARREGSTGRLREAHGGTLFLDEIGDMPQSMQARLLRVLQERQVTPLGGGQAVAVDFSLMCASHRSLREEISAGRFRNDLYYRINGLTVQLPALRERSDFALLCERLLADLNPGHVVQLASELQAQLTRHDWPGNLRQLANVLRTASAMLDAGETRIEWRHLPDDLQQDLQQRVPADQRHNGVGDATERLDEISRRAILRVIDDCAGNLSKAARQLGISRQTLYRKINV